MNSHTPGPWTWQRGERYWRLYAGEAAEPAQRVLVADLKSGSQVVQIEPADVRLIAAAPDLLAALEELTRLTHQNNAIQHAGMEVSPEAWSEMYDATNKARAVIAVAKGIKTRTRDIGCAPCKGTGRTPDGVICQDCSGVGVTA